MIVIVDYDMGNVGSIANMISKVEGRSVISKDLEVINEAEKLILPGVGAFDTGMENISRLGLREVLERKVLVDKVPILGVCLGMQLLGERSEEGSKPGLGWIKAESIRFPTIDSQKNKLRVPHMGWNYISIKKTEKLLEGMYENPRFYFVHSYHFNCRDPNDVLAETEYGIRFTSVVNRENIWGTQFHPEKSHKFGMKIYHNFVHTI